MNSILVVFISMFLCSSSYNSEKSGIIYRNPRVYNVEYSFEMFPDPNKIDRSKDLKLWVPIPREWDSQKAVKIISVEPESHAKYVDPEYGNPMLFWDFGKVPEQPSYRVDIKYRLESYEIHAEIDPNKIGPYDKTNDDYTLYTRSTHTVSITPKVRELAQIAVGDEKNPYLQAKRIFDFVQKKMHYKGGWDARLGDSSVKTLLDSPAVDQNTGEEYYKGSCHAYSIFFVALCRAVGIPSRTVNALLAFRPLTTMEWPAPLSPNGLAAASVRGSFLDHEWAEIYLPNYGWIPIDPTYNSFCHLDSYVLVISKGRDIKIGPDTPQKQSEGYGTNYVLLHDGRTDCLEVGVWNIASIQRVEILRVHRPVLFPADALAEYAAKLYPEAEAEKNLALYRKRSLRWIDQNTREHTDKIAALAQAYEKEPRARYEHEAFICHMLRKVVGDKKFFDIFGTYTNLRVKSGEPLSTARFQKIAEDIYCQPLDWFFKQWVGYTELPQLQLDAVTFLEDEEGLHVHGNLRQLNSSLFRLLVEFVLETEGPTEHKTLWLEDRNTNFEFSTTNRPNTILVDPNNDILQIREMPPLLESPTYDEIAFCVITDQDKADRHGWTPLHFAAEAGRTDIVEFLIAKGADVNDENLFGETPVQIAVRRNHEEVVKLLIEKGADVSLNIAAGLGDLDRVKSLIEEGADVNAKDKQGRTSIYYAARGGHKEVARLLIEKGADVSLYVAAGLGDLDRVQSLIEEGADVNAEDRGGETPLHNAVRQDHKEVVRLLLSKGANVDATKTRYTPLTWAIWMYDYDTDTDIIKMLVTHGADVNFKPKNDDPAIFYSVWNKDIHLAELLLAHGARLDVKSGRGWSVLRHSASQGNRELVELFVSKGAKAPDFHLAACLGNLDRVKVLVEKATDVNTKDELGWTPLYWAVSMGREEVAEFLISKGADIGVKANDNRTLLHQAAQSGAAKLVELLISKGADSNARDEDDNTPLHSAAESGHKNIVELLIAKGADVKAAEKSGNTPLHEAATVGNQEIVELLISKGADINATANAGTPLHRAAARCHTNIVEILLAKGVDVNAKDHRGRTALDLAQQKDRTEIVELLRKYGAKEYDRELNKSLLQAVEDGDVDKVKSLISKGADVNRRVGWWGTLHIAAQHDHKEVVELLIVAGANVDAKDVADNTPLHCAAVYGHKDIIKLLINHGADLNIQDSLGYTALHYSASAGHRDVVELLITKGAQVNSQQAQGSTPLHEAAKWGQEEVAKLLISKGANVNAEDKEGRTPLWYAKASGNEGVVELLPKQGLGHDLAVADISMPSSFTQGDCITVFVDLVNKSDYSETLTVTLSDVTDSATIGTKSVHLSPAGVDGMDEISDMIFPSPTVGIGRFGQFIDCGGDVNGDGYNDILISAPWWNNEKGRAYLYYGGPKMDTNPDKVFEGENSYNRFGIGICLGDVNGDNYDDVLIGAVWYNNLQGRVYIFHGGPNMDMKCDLIIDGEAGTTGRFGYLINVGDEDNDNCNDLLITAPLSDTQPWKGRAYLYYGGEPMDTICDKIFEGENESDLFGVGAVMGDVDGDGYKDILIGAARFPGVKPIQGRAYLYYGNNRANMDTTCDLVFRCPESGTNQFGVSVEIFDIDNDNYADVLIGARFALKYRGRVYIYWGDERESMNATSDRIFSGEEGSFPILSGNTISCGNFNNDEYTDIAIAAYNWYLGNHTGRIYLHYGNRKSLIDDNANADKILTGILWNRFGVWFGVGDLNKDNYDDIVSGGYMYNNNQGRAWLYYGSPGDSTKLKFDWDTTNASVGTHILKAEIAPVTGEEDTADNTKTITIDVKAPSK